MTCYEVVDGRAGLSLRAPSYCPTVGFSEAKSLDDIAPTREIRIRNLGDQRLGFAEPSRIIAGVENSLRLTTLYHLVHEVTPQREQEPENYARLGHARQACPPWKSRIVLRYSSIHGSELADFTKKGGCPPPYRN
jgi:hypothetical protein